LDAFSLCTQPPQYDKNEKKKRKNASHSMNETAISPPPTALPIRHPVRLFTVLRNPVDKFLSAIFFWKNRDIDAVPELKLKISEANASSFTVKDMELLTKVMFRRDEEKVINAGPLFP
jgi:hypothetical protein